MSKDYFDKAIVTDLECILLSEKRNKKHTVLTVDDEENNLSLLKRTLRSDYNIISASSGKEALDILDKQGDEISLIVSDQKMPVMEGD